MKKNAFTLIEVMVVLSVLAIIAILAYNFFGSTMKEAKVKQRATQIYNEMNAIATAVELYYVKNGTYPSDLAAGIDQLVADGQLKAPIYKPPQDTVSAAKNYDLYVEDYNYCGGGSADVLLWVSDYVNDDVCAKFNAIAAPSIGDRVWRYTTYGGTDPSFWPSNEAVYCKDNNVAVDRNQINWYITCN